MGGVEGDLTFVGFVAGAIVLLVLLGIAFAFFWSVVWAYQDAQLRERPAFLVVLLVVFLPSWPLGLIAWYVFRPPIPATTKPRHRHERAEPYFSAPRYDEPVL